MSVDVADYRQAQETLWGEQGVWAHKTFDALNRQYFSAEIPYRGIVLG